jgi:hypothetical protein
VIVGGLLGGFLSLSAVLTLRQRRSGRGLTEAEAAHAGHREQRRVGDDYQAINDPGRCSDHLARVRPVVRTRRRAA